MTDAWAACAAPHVPASTGCRPRRAGRCGRARRRAREMPAVGRAVEVDAWAPVLSGPRGREERACCASEAPHHQDISPSFEA